MVYKRKKEKSHIIEKRRREIIFVLGNIREKSALSIDEIIDTLRNGNLTSFNYGNCISHSRITLILNQLIQEKEVMLFDSVTLKGKSSGIVFSLVKKKSKIRKIRKWG